MRRALALLLLLGACKADPDDFPYCCEEPPRIDAVPPVLNPALPGGEQGCIAGQKATWFVIQETPERLGKLACAPAGTVPEGGGCVLGPAGETTGFDDCAAGLVCSAGVCADICLLDTSAPPAMRCATGTCTVDPLLFTNGADQPAFGACR